MGKKKRKKSSQGILSGIVRLVQGTLLLMGRSLPLVLILGLGALAFTSVKSALYADSGFSVQRVVVSPSMGISAVQRERIESQCLGKNILNVDIKSIAANLEKDPGIQSAVVERRIPSELNIQIVKRNPIAFIHFGTQQKYGVISQDGMILDLVDEKAATGLIIEAPGSAAPGIGQFYKSRGYGEAIRFLEIYLHHPMASQEPVTKVILDHLGNVSVFLKGGPEVRLGRHPSQRIEAFKKIGPLLESEMRKKIDYLDLQFDDVIVKQKKGVK